MLHLRLHPRTVLRCISTSSTCQNESSNTSYQSNPSKSYLGYLAAGVGVSLVALLGLKKEVYAKSVSTNDSAAVKKKLSGGQFKEGLPVYRADEVAKHDMPENRIWVTYKRGVYDITSFVAKHPGGEKILMAAGGPTEPFWSLYAVHLAPHVMEMMEKYRIGNLHEDDAVAEVSEEDDPYAKDPLRNKLLIPRSGKPCNAETPADILAKEFLTPNDVFYVRNHLPVPIVDPSSYELEITGLEVQEKTLTLNDLKQMPKHKVVATIMCAGNRRSEMNKVKEVKGLAWAAGAVGNAEWSGPRLIDVLESLGFDPKKTKASHIQFEGLDLDPASAPYGASIPMRIALTSDVILAYEMNGEPIPRDHGYPVRVIVPGVVGARNVKWLGRIIISDEESKSHWQQNDYKGFSPSTEFATADWKSAPAIQDLPVISAICNLNDGDRVKLTDGKLTLKGYAWSGGGRKIARVDITADQGKTWNVAKHAPGDASGQTEGWAWTLWTADVPVNAKGGEEVEVWAKAVDDSYNSQPEKFEHIWNIRGVLNNAYHKVRATVEKC